MPETEVRKALNVTHGDVGEAALLLNGKLHQYEASSPGKGNPRLSGGAVLAKAAAALVSGTDGATQAALTPQTMQNMQLKFKHQVVSRSRHGAMSDLLL